jgi:hypothetical protein
LTARASRALIDFMPQARLREVVASTIKCAWFRSSE